MTIGVAFEQPVACAQLKIIEQQRDNVFLVVHFLRIHGFLQLIAVLIEDHACENEAVSNCENGEGEADGSAELCYRQ